MTMNLVWVLSLLLAALAMVPAAAHLLELPNKIRLTGKEYLTVQRLYRGWALAGIVVNHNIVLIDTFHRLRDSGMDPVEAVIRSSAQRLRPVFLTTITAIGGLLPMMFAVEINFATRHVTIGGPNGLIPSK